MPLSNSEFVPDLLSLISAVVQEANVEEWLSSDDLGYQHLDDEQIVTMVNELNGDQQEHDTYSSESEDEVTITSISTCPVSNKEAVQLFEKCIVWLQHQSESTVYSTTLLMSLKDLATKNGLSQLKQLHITSFM